MRPVHNRHLYVKHLAPGITPTQNRRWADNNAFYERAMLISVNRTKRGYGPVVKECEDESFTSGALGGGYVTAYRRAKPRRQN